MKNGEGFKKWLLPSIADVIFVAVLFINIGGLSGDLLRDGDTGFHIRAGEYIIRNLDVPEHDIFSYRRPALGWTAHEWLSEVIFALVYGISGLTGLVIASSLVIASVYYLLMKYLRAAGMGAMVSALLVVLVSLSSAVHWLARPHIFSLLMTMIFYSVIDAYQSRNRNLLYLLPPLMLIWVNLHGGFILGLALLAIYGFGNMLEILFGKGLSGAARAKAKGLGIAFGLCLIASMANPAGADILLFPFRLTGDKFLMDHGVEWLSPNFHKTVIFEFMLLLMVLAFGLSAFRLTAIESLLVLAFTHMSLYSVRYIPLYALVASPIIGRRIEEIIQSRREGKLAGMFLRLSANVSQVDSQARGRLWPLIAIFVAVFLALTGRVQFDFDKSRFPVDAVEFIKKEKLSGNMFNGDEFGDYINYSAWPEYRVFIDSRADMYGAEGLKEYYKVTGLKEDGDEVLNKYNIKWIIYDAASPLSLRLLEGDDWKLIYADKVANIFVRNTPENAGLIEKYRDVSPVK